MQYYGKKTIKISSEDFFFNSINKILFRFLLKKNAYNLIYFKYN